MFASDATATTHEGSINLSGTLHCSKSGKKIGHFKRRFTVVRDAWHANHQEFFVDDPEYKRRGIARNIFSRAVRYYAKNGVDKISLQAVRDGRYVWLSYGFRPEANAVSVVHAAMRRAYKKATKKEISREIKLPRRGQRILDFRFRGIAVGELAVEDMQSIVLTMDLRNVGVRAYLVARGWLEPWRLLA